MSTNRNNSLLFQDIEESALNTTAQKNSHNDNSDNSVDTKTISLSKDDNSTDNSTSDSNNDNSNNSQNDSENDSSNNSTNNSANDSSNNSVNASHNDNSATDNSDNSTDNSTEDNDTTTVDVALDLAIDKSITGSFNEDNDSDDDDSSIHDSFNQDNDTKTFEDNDFAEIDVDDSAFDNIFVNRDGVIEFNPGDDVNFENVFNGAFTGGGSDNGFAINQVADIVDYDSLSNVSQSNSGTLNAYATGGAGAHAAAMSGSGDPWLDVDVNPFEANAGDDVSLSTVADASAALTVSAYNMEVVLGANLQQNAVDVTVVGGDNIHTSSSIGDDA